MFIYNTASFFNNLLILFDESLISIVAAEFMSRQDYVTRYLSPRETDRQQTSVKHTSKRQTFVHRARSIFLPYCTGKNIFNTKTQLESLRFSLNRHTRTFLFSCTRPPLFQSVQVNRIGKLIY